ncbi:MAG: thermonuclease family protein [Pseudomonadota bacterium]
MALTLAPALLGAGTAADRLPGPIEARVVRVIDGDTIAVRARIWLRQEVETNVRLAGLDTPEKNGRCEGEREMARKAQAFVEAKLAEGQVTLRDIEFEKYGGRVLARVLTPAGEDLGQLIIDARLGRAYEGRTKAGWCD